jgi:hypothetical protein
MANRSPNKTRALSCRKITRGLARGRKCYRRRFLLRHPSPDSILIITGVRRGQGSARETLTRKNPERGSRPGFPELSLILGSRPYGGVSGGWGAVQPAHERQQHLCREMGRRTIRLTKSCWDRRIVTFHCTSEQRDLYFRIRRIDTARLLAHVSMSSPLTREIALMKIYPANIAIHASMQIMTMATAKKIKSRFESLDTAAVVLQLRLIKDQSCFNIRQTPFLEDRRRKNELVRIV